MSVRQPMMLRKPVGYNRAFLDSYRPNETCYLTKDLRAELLSQGHAVSSNEPAGTYARQLAGRLLIRLHDVNEPRWPGAREERVVTRSRVGRRGGLCGRCQRGLQGPQASVQRTAHGLVQRLPRGNIDAGEDFFDSRCRVADGWKAKGSAGAGQLVGLRQR